MTVVLVHGIPEASEIWAPLQAELAIPTVALTLPGFAASTPPHGTGSKDDLASWLDGKLSELTAPIDIVGHDLGALLVMRLATAGTTPIRTRAVDVPDLFAPDARFSPRAQQLQRDDDWHEQLQRRTRRPWDADESWAADLRTAGVPGDLALHIAAQHDDLTDSAIGAFYRSANPNVAKDWWPEPSKTAQGRGLVLLLPDPPVIERRSHDVARRLGARTAQLEASHCWMAAHPIAAAEILTRFWAA